MSTRLRAIRPRRRRGSGYVVWSGALPGAFSSGTVVENIRVSIHRTSRFVSDAVLVLTTLGSDADAVEFARILVEEHLAACVNVLPPMTSVYRWKGGVEQESEHQVVIKTTRGRVDALASRLHKLHPYDVPEFLRDRRERRVRRLPGWLAESVR